MIFGDEKLNPLRSVPHCTITPLSREITPFGSFNRRIRGSGIGSLISHIPKILYENRNKNKRCIKKISPTAKDVPQFTEGWQGWGVESL